MFIKEIEQSYNRIKDHIIPTNLVEFKNLNELMGNRILFKLETLQKSGSYKYRGAINAILYYLEMGNSIEHIFAYSSGNHAIALSEICRLFNIKCHIFVYNQASKYKIDIIKKNKAVLHEYPTRQEAETECYKLASSFDNSIILPPSELFESIYGQASVLYEILQNKNYNPDYVFLPCGGGGLCAGSLINTEIKPNMKIIAIEPENANKALRSFDIGKRFIFKSVPNTIADGARPLNLSSTAYEIMKKYHKNLEIYTASDQELIRWTLWLEKMNLIIEPTSALAFAGMYKYLRSNPHIKNKEVIVILTGRNYDYHQFKKEYNTTLEEEVF